MIFHAFYTFLYFLVVDLEAGGAGFEAERRLRASNGPFSELRRSCGLVRGIHPSSKHHRKSLEPSMALLEFIIELYQKKITFSRCFMKFLLFPMDLMLLTHSLPESRIFGFFQIGA